MNTENKMNLKQELLDIPGIVLTETCEYMWISFKITMIPFSLACVAQLISIVFGLK